MDQTARTLALFRFREALKIAEDADLDLVEVAPNSSPPVCRVMDFGKFLYERTKKEREARKAQVKVEIKEIRLRPKTNEHHRSFKTRDARRWLESGMKVKVTIRFRGREITYPELALEDLKEIAQELEASFRCRADAQYGRARDDDDAGAKEGKEEIIPGRQFTETKHSGTIPLH